MRTELGQQKPDGGPFARRLARELPDATLHVGDSSGHDIGHDRSDEIMSVLASHMK